MLRYKYQFKNLLQYGLLAEKDAGEQFFKGPQKRGFDFSGYHRDMLARRIGKRLAATGGCTLTLQLNSGWDMRRL